MKFHINISEACKAIKKINFSENIIYWKTVYQNNLYWSYVASYRNYL